MNHVLLVSMAVVCMLFAIPLVTAIDNPTVDINISRADIGSLIVEVGINNSGQRDVYFTGIEYSAAEPIENYFRSTEVSPKLMKANKSYIIYRSKEFFDTDSLKRFYHMGSTNVTVSGTVFVKDDSNSFAVPFHKTTIVFLEIEGAKHAISPNITDIKLELNRLADEKGAIKEITATINISIYNPNPVAISLVDLHREVIAMYKKDDTLRTWKTLLGGYSSFPFQNNPIIMPMNTYVHSTELKISDNETIQYFVSKEPKYIKVKGESFLIPNQTGWSPAYFEPTFNTIITITNGSVVNEEVVSTPTPTPALTYISISTPKKNVPGFKVVFTTISLLTIAFLLKKRN